MWQGSGPRQATSRAIGALPAGAGRGEERREAGSLPFRKEMVNTTFKRSGS